jgi:hypothetical protein
MPFHPPPFHISHTIADWPECYLQFYCPGCQKGAGQWLIGAGPPTALILDVVAKLKCTKCRVPAEPVYLCATRFREFMGGERPSWALELVPPPDWRMPYRP